jgi:hypothetical protein
VPHEVEKIFMPQMKKILLEIDPTLNVLMVDHEEMPKVIKVLVDDSASDMVRSVT